MKHLKFILALVGVFAFATFGSAAVLGAVDTVSSLHFESSNFIQYAPAVGFTITGLSFFNLLPQGVVLASPLVSGLSTYVGKWQKELIGQLFNNLDTAGLNIVTNATGKTYFPKLSVGRGVKKYSPTFNPSDDLTYTDRAITPELAKRELLIEPKKYISSFMRDQISMKATGKNIPFEPYVMKKVMEAAAAEVNDYIIGAGDTTSLDDASAVTNGFLKIITTDLAASAYTAVATGAWTNVNAYLKAEQMFKALSAPWKLQDTNMYMSLDNFFKYLESYRAAFPYDTAVYSDGTTALTIKHSNGKCKIMPVTWLGASNRVIIAPQENMVVLTNSLDDMNAIETVQDVWTVKMGMSFLIGVGIPDAAAIWVNDQA